MLNDETVSQMSWLKNNRDVVNEREICNFKDGMKVWDTIWYYFKMWDYDYLDYLKI